MPGLVGIIANDSARYSLFASCIDKLILPDGWKKEWLIGGDWCGARNTLCQMVLDEGYSHLWFMDDDHAFPPSLLTRLAAHDVPLVTPICLTRVHPFAPVQYTKRLEGEHQYLPIPLSESATNGLVEIEAGGCAGMLIKREVIQKIAGPTGFTQWFEYTDRSEDIVFCEKAKAAGFTLYADLSCVLGHITTAVVWPQATEDGWRTGLTIGRDLNLVVDTADTVAARQKPWIWRLCSEKTPSIIFKELHRAPGEPVNWAPQSPEEIPYPSVAIPTRDQVLQWWLDEQDGNGFHPVGDPFTYTLEEVE